MQLNPYALASTMPASRLLLVVVIALPGCDQPMSSIPLEQLLDPVVLHSGLTTSGMLRGDTAFLVVHNSKVVPDTVLYGACTFAARVYTGASFTIDSWQSLPRSPQPCVDIGYMALIPPSDSTPIAVAPLETAPTHGQVRVYYKVNSTLTMHVAGTRDVAVPQLVLANLGLELSTRPPGSPRAHGRPGQGE